MSPKRPAQLPPQAARRFTLVEDRYPNQAVVGREIVHGGAATQTRILVGKSDTGWHVLELLD
ncbi:MAG: hypothetical protein QM811_27465 [Pirellulales bacterium]